MVFGGTPQALAWCRDGGRLSCYEDGLIIGYETPLFGADGGRVLANAVAVDERRTFVVPQYGRSDLLP